MNFLNHIKDAIKYAYGDITAILFIGGLMTITSIINKNEFIHPVWSIFTVSMFFVVGYGSYVSWYTIKGLNKHPKIKNLKKLFGEGFKKSMILTVYSVGLTFFFHHAAMNFISGNTIIALICIIFFLLIYVLMVTGLINRYFNKGQILKAFNISEIIRMLSSFDVKIFLKLLIAVAISHIFTISVIINFDHGFSMVELFYSISTFFLAPFLFVAMKRFVGLNVRDLLDNSQE